MMKTSRGLILAAAVVSLCFQGFQSGAGSQKVVLEKITQVWPKNANTREAAAADLDGDGDLDLVFGSMYGPSTVFLNDGKGVFSDSGQVFPDGMHGIDVGDVDRDGDIDLFFAPIVKPQRPLYFNDGKGKFTGSALTVPSNEAVKLIDIDGDGDLDAFLALEGFYLNDGKGNFRLKDMLDFRPEGFGDLNGDGRPDAVGIGKLPGSEEAGLVVYLNRNNGTFSESNIVGLGLTGINHPEIADIDGDGDADIIYMNLFDGDPSGILLNDGKGTMTKSRQRLPSVTRTWGFVGTGDLDGDGDVDIVITDKANPAQVWLNDGKGTFTDSGLRLGDGEGNTWTNCLLRDFDNDGDLDIFVTNRVSGNHGLWLNRLKEKR